VVLPAQAEQRAMALRAQGEASYTEEAGRAQAAVLQLMTDAWQKAGSDARDIFPGNDNRLGTDWRVAKIDSFGCWLSLAPGFLVRAKLDPRLDRAIVSLISLK
jgi:hypothetical protein